MELVGDFKHFDNNLIKQLNATQWLEENEYESVEQMHGSMSAKSIGKTNTLRRSYYIQTLNSFRYLPWLRQHESPRKNGGFFDK